MNRERRRLLAEIPALAILQGLDASIDPRDRARWTRLRTALEAACQQRHRTLIMAGQALLRWELDWAYAQFVAAHLGVYDSGCEDIPEPPGPTVARLEQTRELRILKRMQAIVNAQTPVDPVRDEQVRRCYQDLLTRLELQAGFLRQVRRRRRAVRECRVRIAEHCVQRGLPGERLARLRDE